MLREFMAFHMTFQWTSYFAVLILTAAMSALIAWITWQRRSTLVSQSFIWLMIAITGYAMVAALEAAAIALPAKIFWSKLEYVGSGSVITCFVTFALRFTHRQAWFTRAKTALLWSVPLLNFILVATNEWHGWVWSGFSPGPDGSNLIVYEHGPGFLWIMGCVYVYVLIGALLLLRAVLQPSVLYRWQASMLLLAALIPLFGSSAYLLEWTPPGLNITPMSFMLTGAVFFVCLWHCRMFDLVPIARDLLIENLQDGVLVLDSQHRIIDLNPAACHLLGCTKAAVGKFADQVLAKWPIFVRLYTRVEDYRTEILVDLPPRCLELQLSVLRDPWGIPTGQLILLRDITVRYQAELELRQANERLQSQLLKIETLQTQLQEQAIRDRLTGLFNRHYLEEALLHALVRAAARQSSLAIILLDIDHFKRINDTFGHQGGDRVLEAFGALLHRQIRAQDIACRYGGEEFMVILPNVSLQQAYQRTQQIRAACQALQVQYQAAIIQTTISAGIAMFPKDGTTDEDLLQVADQNLYAAKAAGRNTVRVSSQETGGLQGEPIDRVISSFD